MNGMTRARPLSSTLRSLASGKLTIAVAAIVVLFVFGQVISPGFLSFGHLMSVLRLSVFLGIVALGQSLVVIAGGEGIDLSVGSVISLGVVVSSSVLVGRDANIIPAVAAALAAGFAIGLLNGIGVSYVGIPPLIMTLAMASVVEGLSLI
jgi:ribose transport system permease protein